MKAKGDKNISLLYLAVLKDIVDFWNYVDWSGRREILENAIAFPSCGVDSRMFIQRPAGVRGSGDPTCD
jgi:hypothetical protein